MEAHVISLNDSVEHVFIGPIWKVENLKEQLAEQYYMKNSLRHTYENRIYTGDTPYERYRNHMFWHIRTVPLTQG